MNTLNPETFKAINISTAHLTQNTLDELFDCSFSDMFNSSLNIPVYKKDDVGYFIYITNITELSDLAPDLADVIEYVRDVDPEIELIVFDGDVKPISELQTY